MSAFHNAFEAFLASPGDPGMEARPQLSVTAPSPEAEIGTSQTLRKSTRARRRRKKFESSSSSEGSDSEEEVVSLTPVSRMPTLSRDGSRSRRSTSKTVTPPPRSQAKPKVNGVKKEEKNGAGPAPIGPTVAKSTKPSLKGPPDLSVETACRLCERKSFKAGSDALLKHYALDHLKDELEAEIPDTKLLICEACKKKKLKSKFESRKELALHNATVHLRAVELLRARLNLETGSPGSSEGGSPGAGVRRSGRSKQESGESSASSGGVEVIELDDTSQNGVKEGFSEADSDVVEIIEEKEGNGDLNESVEDEEVVLTRTQRSRSKAVTQENCDTPLKADSGDCKKKELWVTDKKNKVKNETWFVNKECTKPEAGSEGEDEDLDDTESVVSLESSDSKSSKKNSSISKARLDTPKNLEEFAQALKDNLRTKDGKYCKPKDDKNIECVCGKVVRICNAFYWRYMVQKPKVIGGKLVSRGHWYNCSYVKRKGSMFKLISDNSERIPGQKREEAEDRLDSKPKRIKSERVRERLNAENTKDSDDDEEEEEEARQQIIQRNIQELLETRAVSEKFLQDGPCYFVSPSLPFCRECRVVPQKERDDMILKGKFIEDTSNITCAFYNFRKLQLTRLGHLMVQGYLDPVKDPKPEDLTLWMPNPEVVPDDCDVEKTKYILGLIGDQFCHMVQQERKCMQVHMGANKAVSWKLAVKGVREMCDVCRTTIFNYHWICGVCGLFVCLDCYQFRRGGLVKDEKTLDRSTDDYQWPYCTTGGEHLLTNLMLAAIIPQNCLTDLAKKLHALRERWNIPQYCHQKDEIKDLYAKDDGFLTLQSAMVARPGKQLAIFPCLICNGENYRWQADLYRHYAIKHFHEQLLEKLALEGEPPYKCKTCGILAQNEKQIVIHFAIVHRAVVRILEDNGSLPRGGIGRGGLASKMLPSTYRCPICSSTIPAKHRADHLTVHFKDKISPLLAREVPFSCPKCRFVAADRPSLIRHFATRHGLVDAFLKDWLERHGRDTEAAGLENRTTPAIRGPPETGLPECRLCEEFPVFQKNFDFHKHLVDAHFRIQINSELPQTSPFKCPMPSCPYDTKIRHNLSLHYGVTHKVIFKFYNTVMGFESSSDMFLQARTTIRMDGRSSRGRGGFAARRQAVQMEACMVCEEMVSKETMVFHLAHKHFHDKVAHLPQTRPFKCPDCSHVNEFQGGLVKHFGVYHGVFNGILKDMGLLDVREDIKRSTIKFPRPKVERLVAPGPNDNIALELARTAAIWSGNAREEEEVLKEVADLRELERKVQKVVNSPHTLKVEVKSESVDPPVVVKTEPGTEPISDPVSVKLEKPDDAEDSIANIKKEMKAEDGENGVDDAELDAEVNCVLCDNVPTMMNKSDLLRHLVEKHFKQKMYAKLIYKGPVNGIENTTSRGTYKCPLCEFENNNQMNTARHYGIKHRFAHRLYEDIICRPVFSPHLTKDGIIDRRTIRGRPPLHSSPLHRGEMMENCKICKVGQDSPAAYQRHLIKVHFKSRLLQDCPRSKPFVCPNEGCDIERRDRFNLLMHYGGCQKKVWKVLEEMPEGSIEQLDDTSKSKCKLCGKYFTSARYMWTHMGDEHFKAELNSELPSAAPWKCPKCPNDSAYEGTDLRTLRVHYGTRHKAVMPHLAKKLDIPLNELQAEFRPPNEIGKTCQFCNKSFYNQMDFLKHSLLHVRKRVYQDLPEVEPFVCPRCPFTGGSRITLLLHYGLQHNVVMELLKEDPSTLMVDMDFIVKQRNGLGEEEKLRAVSEQAAGLPSTSAERYPELDNKRFPKCKVCTYRYFTRLDLLRHFADNHLKERLCEALGPDPGQYGPHRCPEPGCGKDLKTRQLAWRHYGSAHGHLMKMMVEEFQFKMEEWALPMKEMDLAKIAEEKLQAQGEHKELVVRHQESQVKYQEQVQQYHMKVSEHQQLIQQAQQQAYHDNAETMAAQALAQMAGAPYSRPNPLANLPPPPVAPIPPGPPPPQPLPLKTLEDPQSTDITALPSLEWLDNAKVAQNICELCGEEFTNTNKTRDKGNHQVNHFRDSILQALPLPAHRFECPRCSFVGRDRNALLKHFGLSHRIVATSVRKEMGGALTTEMNEVTHDCKVCSQFFLNQNALNNHLCDSHYGPRLAKDIPYTNQSPYKCPKCNYEAKTHQMTVRHYGVKHGLLRSYMIADGYVPRDPTPPPPPPPQPMSRPPPPAYPEVNMGRSLMNHLGQPSTPSMSIPYGPGQGHHYGGHQQSPNRHYGGSPQQVQSPQGSWIEHYMSPGASPVHQQIKQEEVQFTCPVQGCAATFNNAQILCRHATDKHFVERFARELPQAPPFACPMCGHQAPDQMSLIRHWGIAHKMVIKMFNEQVGRPNCFDTSILSKFEIRGVRENCPLCKGAFQGRQLLMRHLSDTHFKDRMCNGIPDQEGLIYKCPQCNHVARDRQSFVRHYGIVHKMVVKYLNEMGIHTLDDENVRSAPQSPATTPRQYHDQSFSPRGYNEPMGSPGYGYSPHQTPQRSPAYHGQEHYSPAYTSSAYTSPQYMGQSPRNNIGSPQDYPGRPAQPSYPPYGSAPQSPMYGQAQDLSASKPQDLSMAGHPQDLTKPSQPVDYSAAQPGYQGQQYPARPAPAQVQQKPLHVMVNDPYRQPSTPGLPMTPSSQHSNPGTPQPQQLSQPGTPQPPSVPSPASYRQPATPGAYTQEYAAPSPAPVQQRVIVQQPQPVTSVKKPTDYMPQGDDHIQPPEPGTRGPYGIYCIHCSAVKARQPSDFYRHLAETHYKNYLAQYLPAPGNPPYRCPLCPYENKEMSPMIRHYGVAHKKVKEAIGNEVVGKYIPEAEMAPCRPAKNSYGVMPQTPEPQPVYEQPVQRQPVVVSPPSPPPAHVSVKCPYPDCEMEFTARYAFWQHMCDKHLKDDLLKFIPASPSQPYQCPYENCNYVTKDSRQALVRHYGMTHKVVQGLLAEHYPEFLTTDKFQQPVKPVRPRAKSMTPIYAGAQYSGAGSQPLAPPTQPYIQHQGQPHLQQVVQPQTQYYQQPQASNHYTTQQSTQHLAYTQQQQPQEQYDSLNLDNLNPSDFSIPSLSEFLDNPGASFPNLSGADLTNTGYVTAAGHALPHSHMQFEPQMDGTFDPTSITDQSLDGSAGSNPTTPEKNKATLSPAGETSQRKPPPPLKKYCEICGKEYEGKNKSMNKVQHMIHHFKDKLYQNLPPKSEDGLPYKCPEEGCKFETKHKPDWARHYGSVHKVVDRLLAAYLEDHPEAWALQPENKELLREQSPSGQSSSHGHGQSSSSQRPASTAGSAAGSEHLDAGEGLLCKLADLQAKGMQGTSGAAGPSPSPAPSRPSPGPSPVVTSVAQGGRLAVEFPKSDLTRFITSALTEKNVPHAATTTASMVPVATSPINLSPQQMLEQKVQSVINEQQQILNSQKASMGPVKTETATTVNCQPVMSPRPGTVLAGPEALQGSSSSQPSAASTPVATPSNTPQPSPAQPVSIAGPSGPVKTAESLKHMEARQAIQQLLQGQQTKQILIKDPKTGQQHLVVQGQGGQQFLLQKAPPGQGQQLVLHGKDGQRQLVQVQAAPSQQGRQVIIQTSSGPQQVTLQGAQGAQQQVTLQGAQGAQQQVTLQGAHGPQQQVTLQTSQGPQTVTLNSSVGQQQLQVLPQQPRLQAGTKLVQVEEPSPRAQPQASPQPGPSGAGGAIPNQVVSGQGAAAGQQIIQSKIVQHNGRTYLVQVRAQKPIEPGKQIVIKTNQPGVGGPGLVQEVMDEVLRQEYQKAELQKQEQQKQEQQKISELAMQLQGSVQEHLEMVQQSPKKPQPPKPLAAGTKLTLQQQQLLLPTEPHPQIAAQHQAKQQQLRRQQAGMAARPTSILQQQLELPVNSGPSIKLSPPKPLQANKPSSPVQCFLCQEMPWFPNQEHLDNHYSTAHGIMKPAETDTEMDIPAFSNADLEASLSSMTDLKDDGGDFESLLDALPPSPEPEEALDCTPGTSSGSVIRRKSSFVVTGQGTSTTRMCEICGFEPKTKNKSRERMDHLAMKHFRDQMISELRKDKPMKCPRCDIFESKDRQQLFRHMISKHKVLDGYLTEAVEKMKAEGKTPFLSGHLDSGVALTAGPDEAAGSASEEQAAMEAAEAETDKKPDKIMQVDGWADTESDDSDVEMEQLDGAVEGSDSESGTGMVDSESGTGMDADSEFSVEDHLAQEGVVRKGLKLPCPICKEDMKFSRTYHFATSHFRPRLAAILPPAKPFICPDCGEEQMHKMNLWSHYIGRAHKHLDTWLNEYLQAEVKPDWCDPSPPSSRKSRKSSSGLLHSTGSAPSSPLTTPKKLPFSGASTPERGSPAAKEWFCDLCHGLVPQRRETHYASLHFKEKLKTILPVTMPFVCPDCQAEHKHFLNLSTHYLTQHGYLKTWLEEKGIQYEPNRKGRSLTTRVLVPGQNAGETVEAGEVPQSSQDRSSSSKHCLSSSESDEAGEEEEGREYLVMRPVTRTALQEALLFLTQETKEVMATDIKQEIKNEPQDTTEEITTDENTTEENSEEKPVTEPDIKIEGEKPVADIKIEQEKPAATLETHVEPEKEVAECRKVKRKRVKRSLEYNLDEVLSSLLGRATSGDPEPWAAEPPPVQVMTTVALPDNPPPHTWLCDGRLLVLQENLDQRNIKIFQEQWRRGQPVIVANVSNNLDINLWSPKAFNAQFGMLKHNIINCKTHKMIPQVPLKWFWDGFESLNSRMMDKHGMPMLLKLKDWPPEEDFKLYFPNRFEDLMKWLPLGDYTKREGTYNLARYIPDFCVRPDLGPKMYIAYGSPLYPECGSTNLHLDMSDAVNLIVYVGIPTDGNKNDLFEEGLKAVDEAGCDLATKKRVRESGVLVGALWHIFHHRDADKIRDFLNKVSIEKGHKLEPHNDPIHDQSVYLDGALRQRLFKEYGVVGYAIPQCEGDTIFIPAGAPHQVRNIHNCIKVAEDFVSPENLEWCFNITEDFRHLSNHHTNHEDKLQIKNILYHAVKECVAVLENYELKNNGRTC